MEKVLEGDLSRFEVPDLLSLLKAGRRTGVLALERRDQESKLYFRTGDAVFAVSTREELRLGPLLARHGRLPPAIIEQALAWQETHGGRFGQALLASGMLQESELSAMLKVQISEVIFDAFSWPDGVFTFWDKVTVPLNAVTLEMELQNILIEGVRRLDLRDQGVEAFPDRSLAVEAIVNAERVTHSVTLTPEEWRIFFLLDGRRTVSEICALAGGEEAVALQTLYTLLSARFVTLVTALPQGDSVLGESMMTTKLKTTPSHVPSVEFAPAVRTPKPEDDTRQIVTPKAVQYLANAQKVTVSRLVLVADGKETSFPLTGDTYTLGRHKNNDITVADPKVSSFHARIERGSEGYTLVDLKSRNGTYVNAPRVETALLKTGDEVRLGAARLLYKVDYTSAIG
jgi:hypothetical protein